MNKVSIIFTNLRLQLQKKNFNYGFLFYKFFFNVILWTLKAIIPHNWAHIIKTVFSKLEFLFSVLGSRVSLTICKLRHKLKNAKHLPELTWSRQNKPWCIQIALLVQKLQQFCWMGEFCLLVELQRWRVCYEWGLPRLVCTWMWN